MSSRRSTRCTPSRCATGESSPKPAIRVSSRSSARPRSRIQALPLVRARPDLGDREIAIACASHLARPGTARRRPDAARGRSGASEADLETGPDADPIEHNCSGKHAGFLAVCRARGFETQGYRPSRRTLCSAELLVEVAGGGGGRPGIDRRRDRRLRRCHLRAPARPLRPRVRPAAAARGRARVIAAMRAHPEMLRGPVAADAMLVRELDGWVAKGGAEGLFCACLGRWARGRAEGRGRRVPGHSPCTCRVSSAARRRRRGARLRHGGKQPRGDRRRDQRHVLKVVSQKAGSRV